MTTASAGEDDAADEPPDPLDLGDIGRPSPAR